MSPLDVWMLQVTVVVLSTLVSHVLALGCQHGCDCSFDWVNDNVADNDVTLRYEVMAGLVGGFAPLVIGGLALLTYKLCTRKASAGTEGGGTSGMPPGGMVPPMAMANPFLRGPWRDSGRGSGRSFNNDRRGSTPISLYGETDDEDLAKGSVSQAGGVQGGGRPGTTNSRFTNIHRNVKADLVNQWFKKVNLNKY